MKRNAQVVRLNADELDLLDALRDVMCSTLDLPYRKLTRAFVHHTALKAGVDSLTKRYESLGKTDG